MGDGRSDKVDAMMERNGAQMKLCPGDGQSSSERE